MLRAGLGMVGAGLALGMVVSRVPADRTGETAVSAWARRHRFPALTNAWRVLDRAFNPPWSVVVPTVVSLGLVPTQGWRVGARTGMLTTLGWYASHLAKRQFRRPRPVEVDEGMVLPADDSYPSGHTALASALAAAVAVSARGTRTADLVAAVGVPVVVATAASRVQLGAHHPADVVGAPLLAVGTVLVLDGLLDAV